MDGPEFVVHNCCAQRDQDCTEIRGSGHDVREVFSLAMTRYLDRSTFLLSQVACI